MNKTFNESLNTNPYFQSLPIYIQETIKQSGIDINSEEELRSTVENLLAEN